MLRIRLFLIGKKESQCSNEHHEFMSASRSERNPVGVVGFIAVVHLLSVKVKGPGALGGVRDFTPVIFSHHLYCWCMGSLFNLLSFLHVTTSRTGLNFLSLLRKWAGQWYLILIFNHSINIYLTLVVRFIPRQLRFERQGLLP